MPVDGADDSHGATAHEVGVPHLARAGAEEAPLLPPAPPVSSWPDRVEALDRMIVFVARLMAFVAGLLLLTIALITIYEVVARKTGRASTWAFEYANYLFVWAVFLALPFTEADGGQIQIDLWGHRGSPRLRRARRILMKSLSFVFMVLVGRQSLEFVQASFDSGETANTILRTPLGYVKLILPVGLFISAATLAASLLRDLVNRGVEEQIAADTEEVAI